MKYNTDQTDAYLVGRYIAGDDRAFDEIVSRHESIIIKQIKCLVKNKDIVYDLYQDTLIKIMMQLRERRYKEEGHFSGWIIRLTTNVVMDHYRRTHREINLMLSTDDKDVDILNREELSEASIEQEIIKQQDIEIILKLMHILPENQCEILEMRFYQDLSFREIAELKGISINTALGRMHYAIKNLRKLAAAMNII